jgi:hypothetical protein
MESKTTIMKYTFLIFALAATIASCGSEADTEETTATSETEIIAEDAEIDPVCDMVRSGDWEDFTVNGEDTIWFCSHVCKGAR